MDKYGLLGKNIGYSFSRRFFSEKFLSEGIAASYQNFDIENISEIKKLLTTQKTLKGLNVTIPYKEAVLPYLDQIDPEAKAIGAVNTIAIKNGHLTGYNTDVYGFMDSLSPLLQKYHKKALVLGTGGASKAVVFGLKKCGINPVYVSRKKLEHGFTYAELSEKIMTDHLLIVNCTPLGTYPNIDSFPEIPYQHLGKQHLLYDLTYNPPLSAFLSKAKAQGTSICNGQKMLERQAEKAWEIWDNPQPKR